MQSVWCCATVYCTVGASKGRTRRIVVSTPCIYWHLCICFLFICFSPHETHLLARSLCGVRVFSMFVHLPLNMYLRVTNVQTSSQTTSQTTTPTTTTTEVHNPSLFSTSFSRFPPFDVFGGIAIHRIVWPCVHLGPALSRLVISKCAFVGCLCLCNCVCVYYKTTC